MFSWGRGVLASPCGYHTPCGQGCLLCLLCADAKLRDVLAHTGKRPRAAACGAVSFLCIASTSRLHSHRAHVWSHLYAATAHVCVLLSAHIHGVRVCLHVEAKQAAALCGLECRSTCPWSLTLQILTKLTPEGWAQPAQEGSGALHTQSSRVSEPAERGGNIADAVGKAEELRFALVYVCHVRLAVQGPTNR